MPLPSHLGAGIRAIDIETVLPSTATSLILGAQVSVPQTFPVAAC